MKLTLNEKIHIAPKPKAKHFRQALVFSNDYDLNDITPDLLDELLQYVCDVFQNKFEIEDIYEHLHGEDLIPLVIKTINFVATGKSEEDNKKKITQTKKKK